MLFISYHSGSWANQAKEALQMQQNESQYQDAKLQFENTRLSKFCRTNFDRVKNKKYGKTSTNLRPSIVSELQGSII